MSDLRLLVVPGGTSPASVAMAHASLHKLVELHEERQADPNHPAPRTVVVIRDPAQVPPSSLRAAVTTPREAFPPELYPELADRIDDPNLFDGIDLVLASSGSSGEPHLVGLSIEALLASVKATHSVLDGPGRWILALASHHIAGAQVLMRAAATEISPQIVDCTHGFNPHNLLPAIAGATSDPELPGYLSLVPTQLSACLDAGHDVVSAMASLNTILIGGSRLDPALRARAEEAGLHIVESFGMTETCGGCVYDGVPLPGIMVRTLEWDGAERVAIAGPVLLTRYLDQDTTFHDEAGTRWFISGDTGLIDAGGRLKVMGRADDMIISGGLNIPPIRVDDALKNVPGIKDAWSVGLDDEKWGQVLSCLVVPEAQTSFPPEPDFVEHWGHTIREAVANQIGRPQAPRRIIFVPEIPQLSSGKVNRLAARALAESLTGTDSEWRR